MPKVSFATPELDHDAHPGLVRFVAQIRNTLDLFVAHQLADADQQIGLVHLIGQFVNDNALAAAFIQILEVSTCPHDHTATPGAVTLVYAGHAIDDARGREVRRRDDFDQVFYADLGVLQ